MSRACISVSPWKLGIVDKGIDLVIGALCNVSGLYESWEHEKLNNGRKCGK
jgi:hypothetical protein